MKKMKRYLTVLAAGALLSSGCFASGSVQTGGTGTAETMEMTETAKATSTAEGTGPAGDKTAGGTGATEDKTAGEKGATEDKTAGEKGADGTGTTAALDGTMEGSLYARGLAMVQRMDTMAGSDAYCGMMSSSSEVLDILDAISAGDYTKPKAVYQVKILEPEALDLALAYGKDMGSLPEELKKHLRHRLVAAVPSMMSSFNGASSLAAVSLITSEDFFLDEDVSGETLYIYVYDEDYCASVLFSARGEGIVSASSMFICNDGLKDVADEEAFAQWLNAYTGDAGVEVSTVSP